MQFVLRVIASALFTLPITLSGQSGGPSLKIGEPSFTTGDLELHRVRGAGLLPDGRIAIANAGAHSVVIVNQSGAVEEQFGRKGEGPGDFGGLDRLATFGDTIVTWDGLLRRITLWRADGTVIRSLIPPVSQLERSTIALEALVSPSSYLATVRAYPPQREIGVYLNIASLFAMEGTAKKDMGQQPWTYTFFYADENGTSSFRTPFLGASLVTAAAGKTVLLRLGESRVSLIRADGSLGAVPLPITPVTGSGRAKAYADSMIAAQSDPDPRWVNNIQAMFGTDFPDVDHLAVARRAVTVGSTVWFQEFQQPRSATTTWWIVDAQDEQLVGSVALPASATVLGGNDEQVLIQLVDQYDVQSVGLFDFPGR